MPSEPTTDRRNDLLTPLCHELLNSLTVIAGYAHTLRMASGDQAAEVATKCAEVIDRHAARMEAQIRNVREADLLASGTLGLRTEPVDLGSAAREVIADLAGTLGRRPVSARIVGDNRVSADPARVRQIIANLLTNACKFSPAGTDIEVSVSSDGEESVLTVTDQGPGVSAEWREAIFERFGRPDANVPGSGLGLYVARGLARAHGGDVEVADSSTGACFMLRLPLAVRADLRQS
jgi:two-component system, OmpR family, sensor histidine kinase KdpD